jgi:ATP-binding cassette subfamily B protein
MILNLKKLWGHLSKRRQYQFWILIIIMIIASFAEILSLGAVIPFLGAITSPETVYTNNFLQPFFSYFEIESAEQTVLPLTIVFISSALFAGAIRIGLLYFLTRLSFATGADLSIQIYRKTLYKKYEEHMSSNSSEIINGIITKTNTVIGGVITPSLNFISSTILLVSILSTLIIIEPLISLIAFSTFGILYTSIFLYSKKKLLENGHRIANDSTLMIRSLQEGLGGIREVLIDRSQEFYSSIYQKADSSFRKASGMNIFITSSPRFAMEAVGMSLIAFLAFYLFSKGDNSAIPLLGALALGAQRLLPVLQVLYATQSTVNASNASLQDILGLMDSTLPEYANQPLPDLMPFNKSIKLVNVSFKYNETLDYVLKDINLTIKKGTRVGFIGETGCGKSTLIDIIMGLLTPTEGKMIVDNTNVKYENSRSWQGHIAHVPQSIYLSDTSIQENIAFAIPKEEIDQSRVIEAAKKAKIHKMAEESENKYQTSVGEAGIRLSGGQKQRVGIARALYKNISLLIFDEATSALDSKTEIAVMEQIQSLNKDITILIIAHRLSTLDKCDEIYELTNDGISLVDKTNLK